MSAYLDQVVSGEDPPGRYRLARPVPIRSLYEELSTAGWIMRIVDGGAMVDRASMFDEFAAACDFPDWFGRNWDAFVDCLRDLSWLPDAPVVVLWQRSGLFASAAPQVWSEAGRLIDSAISARVEMDLSPLYVIYPAAGNQRRDGQAGANDDDGPMLSPIR